MVNNSINVLDMFLLRKTVGKNNNIKFINMSKSFNKYFKGIWSTAMYYPIMLSSLCKETKILFLDADTVITGDLSSLYNTDITNYYCAAVKDYGLEIQRKKSTTELKFNKNGQKMLISDYLYNKLNFSEKDLRNYFNSGVLLLNLEKIREDNLEEKMLKYVENNDLMFPDQDCLNVFFKGKTKLMPYTYNFQILGQFCIDLFNENDSAKFNEYLNQNKNPIIIHYINKPFRNANNVYFGEKYFYYRKKHFGNIR